MRAAHAPQSYLFFSIAGTLKIILSLTQTFLLDQRTLANNSGIRRAYTSTLRNLGASRESENFIFLVVKGFTI